LIAAIVAFVCEIVSFRKKKNIKQPKLVPKVTLRTEVIAEILAELEAEELTDLTTTITTIAEVHSIDTDNIAVASRSQSSELRKPQDVDERSSEKEELQKNVPQNEEESNQFVDNEDKNAPQHI